jgi:chromosome segregation ATPase
VLNTTAAFGLKLPMPASASALLKSQIATLHRQERDIEGQLRDLEEEIDELRALHRPIGQRRFPKHDRLREAYWAVKDRLATL